MKKSRPAKPRRRFWRIARRLFRWCRITVWLGVLTLLILLLWLHNYGLPDFVKQRLVLELRTRGVELRFTRMRLDLTRGVVADNIQFGRAGETNGPRASATEAEVHLRWEALRRLELDIEGVELRGGRVILPVWGTNDVPQELQIEKVNGELKFLPGDQWDLSRFQAETFGVGLRLSGAVTNATAFRSWKFGRVKPRERSAEAFWHDLITQFEQTKFTKPTEIVGTISGDARRLESFRVNVNVRSLAIDSPWGTGSNFVMSAQITPQPDALIYAEIKLSAQDAATRWGRASSVELDAQLTPSLTQWTPTNAHLDLKVKRAQTPWGSASALTILADFRPNPSEATTALAAYSIRGQQMQTKWMRFAQAELSATGIVSASNAWPSSAKTKLQFSGGSLDEWRAASGRLEAQLTLPAWEEVRFADTNLSWRARVEKMSGDVSAQFTALHTPDLEVTNLAVSAAWQAPHLTVRELNAELLGGDLRATAELDTLTRALKAEVKSSLDLKEAAPLLHTNLQRVLAPFAWDVPPKVAMAGSVTLPPWTNSPLWHKVDWKREVLPTLALAGNFQAGRAGFNDVFVSSIQSDFNCSNRIWRLPNFVLTRPGESVRLSFVTHEDTQEFEVILDSAADPRVLRPFFPPVVQTVIDDFTLTQPPILHAELSGQWNQISNLSARAEVAVTNGGYRARMVKSGRGLLTFTNQVLRIIDPEVIRTEGVGRADAVVIDVPQMKLYIQNARGNLNPADITHVVSRDVEEMLAPYRFLGVPQSRVEGMINMADGLHSELKIHVENAPFEWRSFRFQSVTGDVHWLGPSLTISNAGGTMHGGSTEFSAAFAFTNKVGTDFSFQTRFRDINFHSLMNDLYTPTNQLEGTLNGSLVVMRANTEDALSWFGHGQASLTDGLIWDVPALGLFSPILNAFKPGAGNSRARDVVGTFIITNSVVRTDDLVIYASGMRLNYEGAIGLDGRINGRMEADLLRDTPGVGLIVSTVFTPLTKLFEYKVGGTLSKPKSEPLYIPKIMMMPFHPLRTLRELVGEDKDDPLPPPGPLLKNP
jgi:hypothetical protein